MTKRPTELLVDLDERIAAWLKDYLDEPDEDGGYPSLTGMFDGWEEPMNAIVLLATDSGNNQGFVSVSEPDRESWDAFVYVFGNYSEAVNSPSPGMVLHFDLSAYEGEPLADSLKTICEDILVPLDQVILAYETGE